MCTDRGPTPEIVAGLAAHARETLQSVYALSESGTAGPTGGNTPNRTPYVFFSLRLLLASSPFSCLYFHFHFSQLFITTLPSGYVALAISTPSGTITQELHTGVSDRGTNMVLFAEAALQLFLDVLTGAVVVVPSKASI